MCRPGVDDVGGRDAALGGAIGSVVLPFELTGCVGVGVDRELAAELDRSAQQPSWRIEALRTAVDLDGLVEAFAGREHEIRVEGRLGPAPTHDDPSRAVAENVGVRI